MSTLRNTLVVGLASDQFGNQVANSVQHLAGTTNALTVAASTASLGFYGATPVAKPAVVLGNVTSLTNALVSLGLVSAS